MKYYIGIDGGGTKTTVALANEDGAILSVVDIGTSSYKQIGMDNVIGQLESGIKAACSKAGIPENVEIRSCFGMPMFGEDKKNDDIMVRKIEEQLGQYNVKVVNDVEVGWAGSLAISPGINVVSGTGSIAFGKSCDGRSARAGGWSDFFSDEGSCYWLGIKTIELFSKQADLRVERSNLYQIIRENFQLNDDYEIITIIEEQYKPHRDKTASLQLLLLEAARQGDESAKEVYKQAAYELSLLVKGVIRQLSINERIEVSYSGGLFKAGEVIINTFKEYLKHHDVQFITPKLDPIQGALLLAVYYADGQEAAESIAKGFNNNI